MKPFEKCPICGGELIKKEIEKIIKGGNNTATLKVNAEICLKWREVIYNEKLIRIFERIKEKLQSEDTKNFKPIGKNYLIENLGLV